MIGQKSILEMIGTWDKDTAPNYIIICGDKGSGKKLLARKIADRLNSLYIRSGIKVEEVRNVINTATTCKGVYSFEDADNMSGNAKNALLKIVEEPPKNCRFIMTVTSSGSVLETLKSRAYMIEMKPYLLSELKEYADTKDYKFEDYMTAAAVPGDIDLLQEYGQKFMDYVNLVADNIGEVEPSNAFKSGASLAIKNDTGYDLRLFFRAFIQVCRNKNSYNYWKAIIPTVMALSKIDRLGVNKQMVYDMWVMNVRAVL